jgi:hypothetical protein
MHVFFFEIRPIEELQDPSSSPRREEVGRRTLRDYGGFLLSFFYRARFRLFTVSSVRRKASKTIADKPPDTSGVEESDSPRKVLRVRCSDSSVGRIFNKIEDCNRQHTIGKN